MTTTTHAALKVEDLLTVLDSASHGGHGYLTGRGEGDPEIEAHADVQVVRQANELGFDRFDLFEWANSKAGRHYAEVAYSSPTLASTSIARAMVTQ